MSEDYFNQTTEGKYKIQVEKYEGIIYLSVSDSKGKIIIDKQWDDIARNFV